MLHELKACQRSVSLGKRCLWAVVDSSVAKCSGSVAPRVVVCSIYCVFSVLCRVCRFAFSVEAADWLKQTHDKLDDYVIQVLQVSSLLITVMNYTI